MAVAARHTAHSFDSSAGWMATHAPIIVTRDVWSTVRAFYKLAHTTFLRRQAFLKGDFRHEGR